MSEMDNADVTCGRCVGPGMSGRHERIFNTTMYRVLKFCVCCHLFPVFVSVPVCSCISPFILCHICPRV